MIGRFIIGDYKVLLDNLLTNKIIIYFYMLSVCIENRIGRKCQSRNIVTPQNKSVKERNTKITEQLANPTRFNCRSS